MPQIKTMTLAELDRRMRYEYGIKTSKARIADAIEQGIYPFAKCIMRQRENGEKKRIFEIYTKEFEEWANALVT